MARVRVRVEIPETGRTLTLSLDTTADPAIVARSLAEREQLKGGRYWLKLTGSFEVADGSVLELVAEGPQAAFTVIEES